MARRADEDVASVGCTLFGAFHQVLLSEALASCRRVARVLLVETPNHVFAAGFHFGSKFI